MRETTLPLLIHAYIKLSDNYSSPSKYAMMIYGIHKCKSFRSRSFTMKRCSKWYCHVSIAINPCANRCSSRSCDTIAKHFEHILVLRKVFTIELALSRYRQEIKQVLPNLYKVNYLKQVSSNMPQMNSKLVFLIKFSFQRQMSKAQVIWHIKNLK